MSEYDRNPALAGPGMMIFSAVIFGYFGFSTSFNYQSVVTGQFLFFVALLDWTLKGSCIAFGLSAVLTFVNRMGGNLLYSVIGLLSALGLLTVALLDFLDKQHIIMSPVLLLIFAAWNGFGSWQGLQVVLAIRAQQSATAGGDRSRDTASFPSPE